jgi:hypothetical protein
MVFLTIPNGSGICSRDAEFGGTLRSSFIRSTVEHRADMVRSLFMFPKGEAASNTLCRFGRLDVDRSHSSNQPLNCLGVDPVYSPSCVCGGG